MALPDYTDLGRRSKQDRRQGRRETRQDRRQSRRTNRRGDNLPRARYNQTPAAPSADYSQPNSGYTGVYTPPRNDAAHPFFDPQASQANVGDQYGGQQWLQPGSSGYNMYGTQNPAAYYYMSMGQQGLGGLDARSQTAQGMYRDFAAGYEAAKFQNPELLYPDFMEQQNVPGLLDQMSEEQIGIDRRRYQDRSRWGFRGGI
jgi:hypothetical protein